MSDMKNKEHVVIMGAGPAGLATGHELTVSGVKVSVIERNDRRARIGRTVVVHIYRIVQEHTTLVELIHARGIIFRCDQDSVFQRQWCSDVEVGVVRWNQFP